MSVSANADPAMKKKLQQFLSEMLKLGSVKGFTYFSTYLRGREEMILSVLNELKTPKESYTSGPSSPVIGGEMDLSSSFNSCNLPYDMRSLMLSQRAQIGLSCHGEQGVGLPPASPSDKEISRDEQWTMFLVAGYARYTAPFVWVRSNHDRLVRTADDISDKDSPLLLKSTTKWKDCDIKIWDVVAELVKLCTYPPPQNPFSIDFDYVDSLPLVERLLQTGALVNCLQRVLLHVKEDKQYAAKVFEELQVISKKHFHCLQSLVKQQKVPILAQQVSQQQKQHQQHPQQQLNPQQQQMFLQQQQQAPQRKRYPSQTYIEHQHQEDYNYQLSHGGITNQGSLPSSRF